MSYQNKSVAATIAAYRSQPQPYSSYLHNLAALAVQLKSIKDDSWTLREEPCEHYVYVYLDPRKPGHFRYRCPSGRTLEFKHEPFYVGKGKGDRADVHLSRTELAKKSHKNHTFKAILAAGYDPRDYRVRTRSRATDWIAQAFEVDLIAGIGKRNAKTGPLVNLTDGADGVSGYRHTERTKRILQKQSQERPRKPHSAETRRLIGEAHRGKTLSEEQIMALVKANKGRKRSDATKAAISKANTGKRHTEETKELIRSQKLGLKASESTRRKMSKAHLGIRHTEANRKKISENSGRNVPVVIHNAIYRSASEAARQLGVPLQTLRSRINSPHNAEYRYA